MNPSTLINLIKFPDKIQDKDIQELNKICKTYPYFSSAHKLRLIGLKKTSSENYKNALKLTASISGNRTILFDLISKKTFHVIKKKKETNISIDYTGMYSFSEWLKLSKIKSIDQSENIKSSLQIEKTKKIKTFIDNNKNKKITKKDFFSSIQMAEESLNENNHLMTETLAKIYLEQGHYKKAITAYEILSLKYPQKNSFFAKQIKQIKLIKS